MDIGKTHHWVCAVDDTGEKVFSLKVLNDETQIIEVIAAVNEVAPDRVWAIDILGTPSALLVALLAKAGEQMRYASGRVVAAMSTAYTGEGKTDAKDAYVIAETDRIRRADRPCVHGDYLFSDWVREFIRERRRDSAQ